MENKAQWFAAAYLHATSPAILQLDESHLAAAKKAVAALGFIADVHFDIHKSDVMYLFALYNHVDNPKQALLSYFTTGANTALNIQAIVKKHQLNTAKMLDFGTGYGRSLRFLKAAFANSEISSTEIKEEAVAFVQRTFSVKGFHHSSVPPANAPWEQQDLILAQSVFTHLPQKLFIAWLNLLYASLNKGGALLFTFKDMVQNRQHLGRVKKYFAPKDFVYLQNSEDVCFPFLANKNNTDDYGVSFVSQAFISQEVKKLGGEIRFISDALSKTQSAALLIKN